MADKSPAGAAGHRPTIAEACSGKAVVRFGYHCVICAEPCAEPEKGEPPVCESEDCRNDLWSQLHPEDAYDRHRDF